MHRKQRIWIPVFLIAVFGVWLGLEPRNPKLVPYVSPPLRAMLDGQVTLLVPEGWQPGVPKAFQYEHGVAVQTFLSLKPPPRLAWLPVTIRHWFHQTDEDKREIIITFGSAGSNADEAVHTDINSERDFTMLIGMSMVVRDVAFSTSRTISQTSTQHTVPFVKAAES